MSELASILKISFDPTTFVLGAKNILSPKKTQSIKNDIDRLGKIASACLSNEEPAPNRYLSDRVYARFQFCCQHPGNDVFTSRELRMLIYSMYRIKTKPMMEKLVDMLDKNWRNKFFNGLLIYILSNFDTAKEDIMALVLSLMQKRLKAYDGKRDKYLIMKKNSRFFQTHGPEMLGIALRQQDTGQKKNCSLLNMSSMVFGMVSNRIDYEYYSRTIVAYFEKDALSKLDLMEDVLKLHNYDATPKRLIPAIIINENKKNDSIQKDAIRSLAISLIGDPALKSNWSLSTGSEEEKENIEEAREILNEWIKRKIITIFFEKCVHEPTRKEFWLKHSDLIRDFQLYCTKESKAILMQDSRLSSYMESKTTVLMDKKNVDMFALGMSIGKYYMIEFSDVGSIHIYRENSIKSPLYFWQLKKAHMPVIQSFMMDFDEATLPHVKGWEGTFKKWLYKHHLL